MNVSHVTIAVAPPNGTRITGFDAAEGAPGPTAELKTFGSAFGAVWLGLLLFIFLTRRRHDALRLRVEALEDQLRKRPD